MRQIRGAKTQEWEKTNPHVAPLSPRTVILPDHRRKKDPGSRPREKTSKMKQQGDNYPAKHPDPKA